MHRGPPQAMKMEAFSEEAYLEFLFTGFGWKRGGERLTRYHR
jgi:hypothetical protein